MFCNLTTHLCNINVKIQNIQKETIIYLQGCNLESQTTFLISEYTMGLSLLE